MKVTTISIYGFKIEGSSDWNNYSKSFKGTKLEKGKEEGIDISFEVDKKGYVSKIIKNDIVSKVKESVIPKGDSLLVKVIIASEPSVFEDELNFFGSQHKVKFTQTHIWNDRLTAIVFYED